MTGLGFAGLGWLGQSLLSDLPKFPGLQLAAVQDVRPELVATVAERSGSPWSGTDYAAMLALPAVEAVVICTPNALHVPQAQLALEAGKAVLVQKPLALRGADARALVALAQQRQRLLFVDNTYRLLETVACLVERVQRSADRITALHASFHNIYGPGADKTWFFEPRLSGGGALVDLGVHLLDLALALVQPRRVELESATLEPGAAGVESAAALRLQLDGVPFQLAVSWGAPLPQTEISFEVHTPHGRLRWENVDGSFFHFRTRQQDQVLIDRETTLREDTLRAFAAALRGGQVPAIDTRVYDILDAAYGRDELAADRGRA